MVEFAMVAFALYLLFIVLLDFGRATLASQTIQDASTVLANELARAALPYDQSFEDAMADDWVNEVVYDPFALVVPVAPGATQADIDGQFARLPIVNQMLRPLMIRDTLPGGQEVYRYPGTLVTVPDGGLTVLVPEVVSRNWSGGTTGGYEEIVFHTVMEEVHDPVSAPDGHFAVDSGSPLAGYVNVRCHYPYQASATTAYFPDPGVYGPDHAVLADDAQVTVQMAPGAHLPPNFDFVFSGLGTTAAPYDGKYGLGFHYLGRDGSGTPRKVRPFRRLVSVQAAARREVFVPE